MEWRLAQAWLHTASQMSYLCVDLLPIGKAKPHQGVLSLSDLSKLQDLAAQAANEGATLKNIEIAKTDDGVLMLKSADGKADFEISIPKEMLLDVNDIDFATAQVREDSSIEDPMRGWFNAYLAALVDDDDRAELAKIRKAIDVSNLTASSTYRGLALGNFVTINSKPQSLNRALLSASMIATADGVKLVPVLGLARAGNVGLAMNLSAGGSFRSTGRAEDEIRVTMGRFDALHALNTQGRLLDFPVAFSLPLTLSLPEERTLTISRNFHENQTVGKSVLPRAWAEGKDIKMSYCPVSMSARPRMAREMFRAALKPIDISGLDMVWGMVRNYNMSRLFDAYVQSGELKDEKLRDLLTQSIRSQIETFLKSI